jgi:hypothetical protein
VRDVAVAGGPDLARRAGPHGLERLGRLLDVLELASGDPRQPIPASGQPETIAADRDARAVEALAVGWSSFTQVLPLLVQRSSAISTNSTPSFDTAARIVASDALPLPP